MSCENAVLGNMKVGGRKPRMTRDAFLAWADVQRERYEFDGFQPVAMTGGTRDHSQICQNIYAALRSRLRGTSCVPLGPDAGVATSGDAVRYPDALVTCTRGKGTDRLVRGVVAVFEVTSPTSAKVDRIDKVLEYANVPTILHYVILILDHASVGITVHARATGDATWQETTLRGDDVLAMPEIGAAIPVAEFYEGTDLTDR